MTATAILPRSEFRAALAIATKAVDRKNSIPILSNVLLRASAGGGVVVVGTDLDVEISAKIPGASSDKNFAATIPGHALLDLEKKAQVSDQVAIDAPSEEGMPALLDFEGLRVSMQCLPVADFPTMALGELVNAEFDLPTAVLAEAIERVAFAVSTEETRYYLNGIFMHVDGAALRFVATDGHRLARFEVPAPEGSEGMPGIIIPRATVAILKGLVKAKGAPASLRVKVNCVKALFTLGNVDVLTKLVDGTFPDYSRATPTQNDKRATFDKADLAKAITAVSSISSERGRAVKFALHEGRAVLSVQNPDMGRAEMRVGFDCVEPFSLEIGFNAKYVLDILGQIEGDRVELGFSDSGSPALILEPGTERDATRAFFVLMPMRV